jgi:hypothetical protein
LHIPVDLRRFPWVKKLATDYAFQFSALAPFFSGDPASRAAWTSIASAQRIRARELSLLFSALARRARRGVAAAMRPPAEYSSAVTGQQAGLFGARFSLTGLRPRSCRAHTQNTACRQCCSGSNRRITIGMKWRPRF